MTRLYTIEGEQLTLAQVQSRCPGINPRTVRKRLELGWRAWWRLRTAAGETSRSPWHEGCRAGIRLREGAAR